MPGKGFKLVSPSMCKIWPAVLTNGSNAPPKWRLIRTSSSVVFGLSAEAADGTELAALKCLIGGELPAITLLS